MKRLVAIMVVLAGIETVALGQGYGGGGGGGYGGGGGRASTPAEAYAFGVSSILRGQGQYNMATAQAAIAQQQAEQLYIQNRVAATKAYFDLRQMNRDYRAQERGQVNQQSLAQYYEQQKPKKLPPSQLDPVTGKIGWPVLLRSEEYKPYRDEMDAYFKLWAHHQDFSYSDVRKTADAMQNQLRKHIDDLPSQDFEDAHKFIETLAYEGHYPAT